ncbi:Thiamine transporter 1 [Armadillidium vulgare]|nr:Thiamine transporter 1 [Armadillidium vulgare]
MNFNYKIYSLLTSFGIMNYYNLNYFSLASVSIALCIAFMLPPARRSLLLLWLDFRDAYTNIYLLKWSIWWAFATCINFQVGNYIQPLWEDISSFKTTDDLYNGSVEAATTLFKFFLCINISTTYLCCFSGALASLTVGYLFFNWKLIGELTLSLISLIDGLLLYFMGKTSHLWVGYVNYVLFRLNTIKISNL